MRTRSVLARAALVGGLTVALTPALGVTWASACRCASTSDAAAEHASRADAIFSGSLTTSERSPAPGSSPDGLSYTFAVDRVYKGEVAANQRVISVASSGSCGLELRGSGPFLVFASRKNLFGGAATDLNAFLCGGTRPLGTGADPALGEGQELRAVPVAGGDNLADDEGSSSNLLELGALLSAVAAGGVLVARRRRSA